ncbi:MAG: hypothetical protein KGI49_02515 [Patescibacteria group bacterium]|nr:hypothetical protein [Patescibacteria group bacterium]
MKIAGKSVLILTNSVDGEHTDSVISNLVKRKESVFRLNVDELATGKIKLEFHADQSSPSFQLSDGPVTIASDDIKSVWYRRPNNFRLAMSDPVQRRFAEEESRYVLDGLWLGMDKQFWISRPDKIEYDRKKLFQLKIAHEAGFRIPKTIVTNDPQKAKSFLGGCSNGAVFKTIKQGFLDYGDRGFNIPTTLVGPKQIENIDLVKCPPCLFQELIMKDYELRVTIVGGQVFAVRIDSQKHVKTSVDWRDPALIGSLDYELVELPEHIHRMCMNITAGLGLEFGAIDLAVTTTGEYVFFEINPNGQWYWLERLTGACISDAIADMLSSGRQTGKEVNQP